MAWFLIDLANEMSIRPRREVIFRATSSTSTGRLTSSTTGRRIFGCGNISQERIPRKQSLGLVI